MSDRASSSRDFAVTITAREQAELRPLHRESEPLGPQEVWVWAVEEISVQLRDFDILHILLFCQHILGEALFFDCNWDNKI